MNAHDLRTGDSIAGYEIIRHVKSGGMASLYLARRRGAAGFRKLVAIKVVHPHLAEEPRFVEMFLDEAHLAARIAHPNVVHTEELLEEGGTYVMVMEYVHGTSLSGLLTRLAKEGRRLTPDIAAWIAAQIADGLHAAHELRDDHGDVLNVVHRDVSPQNVLLSWDGHVKVIDFGVAKSRSASQRTAVGVLRGKLAYMSPEQAYAQLVDRRTDVYALGIVLWEMLTSRRLFRGNSEIELLQTVRLPNIPPPSTFAAVDRALENAVLRALDPDPQTRVATCKDFRDLLLQARPRAASLHSSDIAELLQAVFGDEIRPVVASEQPSSPMSPAAAQRTVAAMTAHAPSPAFAGDRSQSHRAAAAATLAPTGRSSAPAPKLNQGVVRRGKGQPPKPPAKTQSHAERILQKAKARKGGLAKSKPPGSETTPNVPAHFDGPPPDTIDLIELPAMPAGDREAQFTEPPKGNSLTVSLLMVAIAIGAGVGLYYLGSRPAEETPEQPAGRLTPEPPIEEAPPAPETAEP